jgi:hypothetical protein
MAGQSKALSPAYNEINDRYCVDQKRHEQTFLAGN